MKIFILLLTAMTLSFSAFADEAIAIDILDGKWSNEVDFSQFISKKQKAQMDAALKQIEEMKKKNPAMAKQMGKVMGSFGVKNGKMTSDSCITKGNIKAEMDKALSGGAVDGKNCKTEIITSTKKKLVAKSICEDKTFNYKVDVINKKYVESVITTDKNKKIIAVMKFVSKDCD